MGAALTRKAVPVAVNGIDKLRLEHLAPYKAVNASKLIEPKIWRSNGTRKLKVNNVDKRPMNNSLKEIAQANIQEGNVGIKVNNGRDPVNVHEIKWQSAPQQSNIVRRNNSRIGAKKTAVLARINNSRVAAPMKNSAANRKQLVSINKNVQQIAGGTRRRHRK